jgi:predicted adenylyl cyclase CyaB
MQHIEVEHRSLVTEEKYRWLLDFLGKNAKDLGENNKHAFHFIFPDKLLNVVDLESKDKAKIALKLGKIGKGSAFGETELSIERSEFEKAVSLFKDLGFAEIIESRQQRRDYEYAGVELAVKYSAEWGYHVELEIVVEGQANIAPAEEKIKVVADELGLALMTQEELTALVKKIESERLGGSTQ